MEDFNQRLTDDEDLRDAYQRAHEAYIVSREQLGKQLELEVPEIHGVSAGGMPTRVKCLHAVVGHALAAGEGVNPIGDLALEMMRERGLWDRQSCTC